MEKNFNDIQKSFDFNTIKDIKVFYAIHDKNILIIFQIYRLNRIHK